MERVVEQLLSKHDLHHRASALQNVEYDDKTEAFSCDNEYMPLISLWLNDDIFTKDSNKIVRYRLPLTYSTTGGGGMYDYLMDALKKRVVPHKFSTASMGYSLYGSKGLLVHKTSEGKSIILMMIGIKSDYALNQYIKLDYEVVPDIDNIVLFINPIFRTSNVYKNVYRRLDKELLTPFISSGVDTIITSDIEKWCFKSKMEAPKFSSIREMKETFQELNNTLFK